MKSKRADVRGFTLIELLVVIAIIAVLAALLFPAIGKARRAAARTKAQAAVKGIEAAFLAYFDEYKRWPWGVAGNDNSGVNGVNNEATVPGIEVNDGVMRMLTGEDVNNQNPRQVLFLDIPDTHLSQNGEYVDPWGTPYKYMLDFNMDDEVHTYFSNNNGQTNLNRVVAVWSQGLNKSDEKGYQGDDVRSW